MAALYSALLMNKSLLLILTLITVPAFAFEAANSELKTLLKRCHENAMHRESFIPKQKVTEKSYVKTLNDFFLASKADYEKWDAHPDVEDPELQSELISCRELSLEVFEKYCAAFGYHKPTLIEKVLLHPVGSVAIIAASVASLVFHGMKISQKLWNIWQMNRLKAEYYQALAQLEHLRALQKKQKPPKQKRNKQEFRREDLRLQDAHVVSFASSGVDFAAVPVGNSAEFNHRLALEKATRELNVALRAKEGARIEQALDAADTLLNADEILDEEGEVARRGLIGAIGRAAKEVQKGVGKIYEKAQLYHKYYTSMHVRKVN